MAFDVSDSNTVRHILQLLIYYCRITCVVSVLFLEKSFTVNTVDQVYLCKLFCFFGLRLDLRSLSAAASFQFA